MMTIAKARRDINEQIGQMGEYSHNIVSLTLSELERRHGRETANDLVEELNLGLIFSIWPARVEEGQSHEV